MQFTRLSDEAWFLAGENGTALRLRSCRQALECVHVDQHDEWWSHLPTGNLTEQQKIGTRIAGAWPSSLAGCDVGQVSDSGSDRSGGATYCRQALDRLAKANRYKATHFSRLVEAFCHVRMGDLANVKTVDGIEPGRNPSTFSSSA